MKLFYSTLLFVLIASLAGLAIATAVLPYQPIEPAQSLVLPIAGAPAG